MADPAARSLQSRIQERLSRYYGIGDVPHVDDFVRPTDGLREVLVIRDAGDGLEIALHLPRAAIEAGARASLDQLCQVVEGVSHFLYVAERARRELPTTQLELELQAEVDKYVTLADPCRGRFRPAWGARVRERLYRRVRYADPAGTESGDRYRMANELAARFAENLEAKVCSGRLAEHETRALLRRFYWAGQTEKIELARAA